MRCLFCKCDSSKSKSIEHIIPESLGSKKLVLPPGVVCDKCNNYFATKVERPLLSHPSMRNIRAFYQVPNKKGKLPSLYGKIAGSDIEVSMKLDKDKELNLKAEKARNNTQVDNHFFNPNFSPLMFTIDIDPPQKEMSRLMAKMSLEALALWCINSKNGLERIIDKPHFDLIRDFARKGSPTKNWPYHQRRIFPAETQMAHPETGDWVQAGFGQDLFLTSRRETFFVFVLYGVEFVINLGGPSIQGYLEWLQQNNNISPLIERNGIRLYSKEKNGKLQYFLDGNFEKDGSGVQFDSNRL